MIALLEKEIIIIVIESILPKSWGCKDTRFAQTDVA